MAIGQCEAQKVSEVPEVPGLVTKLGKANEELKQTIGVLNTRLQPILANIPDNQKEDEILKNPISSSPLGTILSQEIMKLDSMIAWVNNIISKMEV
jgi:hypothetical protein